MADLPPGPWRSGETADGRQGIIDANGEMVLGEDRGVVFGDGQPRRFAYRSVEVARVVCAAPEMATMLAWALKTVAEYEQMTGRWPTESEAEADEYIAKRDAARELLARLPEEAPRG